MKGNSSGIMGLSIHVLSRAMLVAFLGLGVLASNFAMGRSGGDLIVAYDCQLASPVQAMLESASWRSGQQEHPIVNSFLAMATAKSDGTNYCETQFSLPGDLMGQDNISLWLPAMDELVADHYPFAGLAQFYNSVAVVQRNEGGEIHFSEKLEDQSRVSDKQWLGWKGRFYIAVLSAPGAALSAAEQGVEIVLTSSNAEPPRLFVGVPRVLSGGDFNEDFSDIRYSHLWGWLAELCRLVEWSLDGLYKVVSNWGVAILLLAVIVRILLLPVSMLTTRWQREVSKNQALLAPQLAEIKANFDGEEAHNRIMSAHKELGITPFFTLKPLFASLIQIPVLIAIFNALGEMPQLDGAAFLWIANLSYPDAIAALPFAVPLLGDTFNVLPFVMTLVSLVAAMFFRNSWAPEAELKRQKRNLYLMTAAFFILFYPFPAAMVLYWTLANALQMVQQRFIKV